MEPSSSFKNTPLLNEKNIVDVEDEENEVIDENDNRYFEKDPVDWLEKYFEREGLPMNFEYSTEGKDIVCSIEWVFLIF